PTESHRRLLLEKPGLARIVGVHLFEIAIVVARMWWAAGLKGMAQLVRPASPDLRIAIARILAEDGTANEWCARRAWSHWHVAAVALPAVKLSRIGLSHYDHDRRHAAPIEAG